MKFGDHFPTEHLPIEHRNVAWFAAGYKAMVNYYFLVHPLCSGIPQPS